MEELIKQMLDSAKKDHKKLRQLKMIAFELNQMDLAAELSDLENKLFPESPETKQANKKAKKLNLVFRMVELNIPNDVAWIIDRTLTRYKKRRGNFDLKDAVELMDEKNNLFVSE